MSSSRIVRQGTVDPVVLIDLPPVLLTDDALVVAPKVDAILRRGIRRSHRPGGFVEGAGCAVGISHCRRGAQSGRRNHARL